MKVMNVYNGTKVFNIIKKPAEYESCGLNIVKI